MLFEVICYHITLIEHWCALLLKKMSVIDSLGPLYSIYSVQKSSLNSMRRVPSFHITAPFFSKSLIRNLLPGVLRLRIMRIGHPVESSFHSLIDHIDPCNQQSVQGQVEDCFLELWGHVDRRTVSIFFSSISHGGATTAARAVHGKPNCPTKKKYSVVKTIELPYLYWRLLLIDGSTYGSGAFVFDHHTKPRQTEPETAACT